MKANLTILKLTIIGLIVSALIFCNQKQQTNCMNPSGFEIKRGTNLSHWLSQDFGWVPKYGL